MSSETNVQKIIVIEGPTASGKSDLAVSVAKKWNGEVVSADSRQVYRGMNIGTGKITHKEMRGIRHHLLDVANPKKRFSAGEYRVLAEAAIDDIISRGKLPIVCGGTGFYIDAVLDENPFPDIPPNPKLRKNLEEESESQLLLILKKLDPKRARAISMSNSEKNNARRIIRAIEIASWKVPPRKEKNVEGQQNHAQHQQLHATSKRRVQVPTLRHHYAPIFIGIKPKKEDLKKRIRVRLLKRIDGGMVAEARRLHAHGLSWRRMEELGLEYRFLARFLQGKLSKEEFVEQLNTAIWHYARRQMTWFKRNKKIRWFSPSDNSLTNYVKRSIL